MSRYGRFDRKQYFPPKPRQMPKAYLKLRSLAFRIAYFQAEEGIISRERSRTRIGKRRSRRGSRSLEESKRQMVSKARLEFVVMKGSLALWGTHVSRVRLR